MKIDDVLGGKIKIGDTIYNMVEAKFNGIIVWPLNYTYAVVSTTVHYSAGSAIYAKGSAVWDGNYAYVTGNVNVYVNGVLVNTLTDVWLTPTLRSGTWFQVDSSNYITGSDLGTTPSAQHDETVDVSYGGSPTVAVTVSQQANVKSFVSATAYGAKKYGTTTTAYSDYQISFSTDKYGSTGNAAPASGATTTAQRATLSYTANHLEVDTTAWTQNASVNYSFTSGHTSTEIVEDYYSGADTTRTAIVSDTPTISGIATGFTRNNLYVTIASEGTDPYPSGRSVTYTATVSQQGGGTISDTVTLYQAKNEIVSDTPNTTRTYGSNYTTTSDSDYVASLVVSQYTTSSSPAPASGGSATIVVTASHRHTETVLRDYTDTTIHTYTWSSGSQSMSSPSTSQGTETVSTSTTTVADSPTPTFSGSHTGFEFNAAYTAVNVASRGTTLSSLQRSATIQITNGTASDSKTIYQAKNSRTGPTYIFDIGVEIQQQGSISAAGGAAIEVKAHSYRVSRYVYDSGAVADSPSNWTSSISTTNCTADQNSIRGDETTFHIEVLPNQSTDPRQIIVTLTANSSNSVSSQRLQEPQDIGVGNVATLLPYIPTVGANKGKVYYTLTINHGSVTSSLVSLNFCYRRNGGSKQTVNVGGYTISETSSPVLFQASGIPNFANDRSVKAWFEVQSTGSFSVIYANESNYYTYVEFDPYIPPTPEPNT